MSEEQRKDPLCECENRSLNIPLCIETGRKMISTEE